MAARLTMKARSADVMLILLATVVAAVALGAMWSLVSVVLRYHDTVQHAGVSGWLVALGGPVVCSALAISFVATHRFRPGTTALILGAGVDVVLACALTRTYLYPCSVPILDCSEQSWDWDHI